MSSIRIRRPTKAPSKVGRRAANHKLVSDCRFFDQKYQGFSAQLRKSFDTAGISHSITYGFERYSIDSQSRRDGGTFDAAGTPLREYTILPTRDFPLTDIVKDAIYVQDEIELLDGKLLLSPSVRFDRFDAEATADSIYLNGNPGSGGSPRTSPIRN